MDREERRGSNPWLSGPLVTHLREAIRLNTDRMPLYARLTDGDSIRFSRELIFWERMIVPVAMILDLRARPFLRRDIPVIADDFVSMSLVGPFRATFPFAIAPRSCYTRPRGKEISGRIRVALEQGGFAGASRAARAELDQIREPVGYNNMVRHLLESLLRAANNAPHHIARCRKAGFRSCEGLSRRLVRAHLPLLENSSRFDERTAPLQARGVPFLFQDLPPIAPLAENYAGQA